MKRVLELAAVASLLTACALPEEGAPGPTPCERLGVAVNPAIEASYGITDDIGDYVIKLAIDHIGDNSVTGQIVEFIEVENQEVCERFLDRGTEKPLQLHGNYNTDATFGSGRRQVAVVVEAGQATPFLEARPRLEELVERQPGMVVTAVGDRRRSYTGDDEDGNAEYERRDVAYQINLHR